MSALAALTQRSVLGTLRDGDLIFAIGGPVAFFVCFNITLRHVIDTGDVSYPQYILPVIVVQAMIFTAMTTADRAARDNLSGMGIRLRSLPIRNQSHGCTAHPSARARDKRSRRQLPQADHKTQRPNTGSLHLQHKRRDTITDNPRIGKGAAR